MQFHFSKICFFSLLLIFGLNNVVAAQETESGFLKITPDWEINDKRVVKVKSKTQMYMNGEQILDADVDQVFEITVKDESGDHYILEYNYISNDMLFGMELELDNRDEFQRLLMQMVSALTDEMSNFIYLVEVEKSTGMATRVVNSDELMDDLSRFAFRFLGTINEEFAEHQQVDSLQLVVRGLMESYRLEALQTVINEINLLLQSYSFDIPLSGSDVYDIEVYETDLFSEFIDVVFPAVHHVNAEFDQRYVTVQSRVEYDKEFLFEQLQKVYGDVMDFTIDDIFLDEITIVRFDLETTWIDNYTVDMTFEMPEFKIIQNNVYQFQSE